MPGPFAQVHELSTRDDRIERMLFAGTSLNQTRTVLPTTPRHRPTARLKIRPRARVLDQWPKDDR
jgi:hypothetical protein